jgi:hypothetical protein
MPRFAVGGPGGQDPDRRSRAGQHVHAALDRAVATPQQHQFGALGDDLASSLRRLLALGYLVPEWLGDPLLGEHRP